MDTIASIDDPIKNHYHTFLCLLNTVNLIYLAIEVRSGKISPYPAIKFNFD